MPVSAFAPVLAIPDAVPGIGTRTVKLEGSLFNGREPVDWYANPDLLRRVLAEARITYTSPGGRR